MKATKENIFLDLRKLSEEQIREIGAVLTKHKCTVWEKSLNELNQGILEDYTYPFLIFNKEDDEWYLYSDDDNRTELTYPDFIKLFEGETCPKCRTKDFGNCHSIKCPMRKDELFEGGEGETQIGNIKDIAHTEGVLIGLKICKEMWAQGTISHENIQEEIYHYQEELDNLNSNQ